MRLLLLLLLVAEKSRTSVSSVVTLANVGKQILQWQLLFFYQAQELIHAQMGVQRQTEVVERPW
jgi:hypothetical protein